MARKSTIARCQDTRCKEVNESLDFTYKFSLIVRFESVCYLDLNVQSVLKNLTAHTSSDITRLSILKMTYSDVAFVNLPLHVKVISRYTWLRNTNAKTSIR
jgi:hypothetical protein